LQQMGCPTRLQVDNTQPALVTPPGSTWLEGEP
jgi:hypothetical protein